MSMKPSRKMRGVSLIELMIAMLIGLVLLLGLIQVFSASRVAYQTSEGLARVQENGRFAMDFLQRDLRMAGHFGCVNDQARRLMEESGGNPDTLVSHFGPVPNTLLDFTRSIQGYEADNTAPGNTWNLSTTAGTWSPGIPAGYIDGAPPRAGSDVVVMRYFSGEGVPVTNIVATATETTIRFDPLKWNVLTQNGVAAPEIFGISDCTFADVFEATTLDVTTGTITVKVGGDNTSVINERYTSSPEGQTFLYRAESIIYFVRNNAAGEPALFRRRAGNVAEELVDGVESLQLLYGQDENPVNNLNGNIVVHNTAVPLGVTEQQWRRVGAVQVGLLMRSPTPSSAPPPAEPYSALGVGYNSPVPSDGRYRAVYESTIALRNRLFGN
jgi:type IV pilus assembly protein PilW